jgi:hypothetical protein
MPGLDPGIQPEFPSSERLHRSLDGRVKPGRDDLQS